MPTLVGSGESEKPFKPSAQRAIWTSLRELRRNALNAQNGAARCARSARLVPARATADPIA